MRGNLRGVYRSSQRLPWQANHEGDALVVRLEQRCGRHSVSLCPEAALRAAGADALLADMAPLGAKLNAAHKTAQGESHDCQRHSGAGAK